MSQVSWSIVAIDKTRAAFASVNQGLRSLATGGDAAQKKIMGLSLRMVGIGSVAAVIATQVRTVAQEIEKVPGVNQDTIDSWHRLNDATETVQGTVQNMAASAGHGLMSLWGLVKFGAIAAVEGLNAAEQDLLATDRQAAESNRQRSGQAEKEIDSMRKLGEARKALRLIHEGVGDSIARRREEAAAMERQAAGLSDLAKKNNLLAAAATLRTEAEKDMISLQDKMNEVQARVAAGEEDIARVFVPATQSLRALNEERAKTLKLLAASNGEILNGNPAAMQKSIKLNEKLVSIDEDRLKLLRKIGDVAAQAGDIMASGFENAVFEGGKLRDVLRGIGSDLLRLIFRNMVTAPLAKSISGGISGGLKSLFGVTGVEGKAAAGGIIGSGQTFLVGENGPELFTANSSGRIIPNHELGVGGGTASVYNFTYNFPMGVTKAELIPALQATKAATIAAFKSMQVRSGRGAYA